MARPRTVLYKLPKGPGADLAQVLARNVLAYRKAKGLSIDQLCALSSLGKRTIIRVEYPEGIADLNTLALLAKALDIHPSSLIL